MWYKRGEWTCMYMFLQINEWGRQVQIFDHQTIRLFCYLFSKCPFCNQMHGILLHSYFSVSLQNVVMPTIKTTIYMYLAPILNPILTLTERIVKYMYTVVYNNQSWVNNSHLCKTALIRIRSTCLYNTVRGISFSESWKRMIL